MKDSIPAALILAFIARRMRTQQQSLREVNELEAMAEWVLAHLCFTDKLDC